MVECDIECDRVSVGVPLLEGEYDGNWLVIVECHFSNDDTI